MYYIAVGCVSPQSRYIKKLRLKANKRKDYMGLATGVVYAESTFGSCCGLDPPALAASARARSRFRSF